MWKSLLEFVEERGSALFGFFLGGLIVLAALVMAGFALTEIGVRYHAVPAVVTKQEVSHHGKRALITLEYRYEWKGQVFDEWGTLEFNAMQEEATRAGKKITAYVREGEPEHTVLQPGLPAKNLFMGAGVLALSGALIMYLNRVAVRPRRNS